MTISRVEVKGDRDFGSEKKGPLPTIRLGVIGAAIGFAIFLWLLAYVGDGGKGKRNKMLKLVHHVPNLKPFDVRFVRLCAFLRICVF